MAEENQRTALYRLLDEDDLLLYVGISWDPHARRRQHAKEKEWWGLVALCEIEWFPTREEATAAERTAIMNEAPRFNGRSGDNPASQTDRRKKISVAVRAKIAGKKAYTQALERGASSAEADHEQATAVARYRANSGVDFGSTSKIR